MCELLCIMLFTSLPRLLRKKIPGNSEPGRELEVSLEGTSLEISCNLCLENFYKAEESAE